MVTYLSPSYTPICTRVHTYTVCFTDSPPSYIYKYIYIYIYTLFHHTKFCICFTTQIDHHHVYTYIVCFTTQSWHMLYHTDAPVLPHWGSQQSGWWLIYHHPINPYAHTYTHIYCLFYRYPTIIHIYIYTVSPHRVEHLLYRTDSPLSYIYIHIYSVSPHRVNICFFPHKWPSFTAQIAHYHIYIHIYIYIYIYTYTHTYILRFTTQESTYIFPHRWPSFTTLGKPTFWMVTYPSPSHTSICTHTYTQMYCLCYK